MAPSSPKRRTNAVSEAQPEVFVIEGNGAEREALVQALVATGFDVVVASSAAAAQRLMRLQKKGDRSETSGPRVEDLGDGTARFRVDQVVPWATVIELLDVLDDAAPAPKRLS